MTQIFALLDCNNFYVSCERLFNPKLAGQPVVVLSNNDGCIIARSNEAKALGIKMGDPFFKCRKFIEAHQVQVFSSNYPLYGDLSQRVMGILSQLEPEVEVYSIDEAFFRQAKGKPQALLDNGRHIRATVGKQVGIPVSIGFGSTKTLAKIANRIAKKQPEHGGVFVLPEQNLDLILATIEVGEVWGIGPRQSQKLFTYGIRTALDLRNANDTWLRKHLTITGLRTAMELRGVSCLPFEEAPAPRKSVTSSRSFGQPVTDLSGLREALSAYVSIAAEKLRAEHKKAGCLQVYLTTNRFLEGEPQYANSLAVNLPNPTASTLALIHHATEALRQLYRPGFSYQKVGVVLVDLVASSHEQQHLFRVKHEEQGELMAALDKINRRWGRDTLQSASIGFKRPWKNKQTRHYLTAWRMTTLTPERYEIYFADLNPTLGSKISKIRPVVIISDDAMNKYLETVVVCPITSKIHSTWRTRFQITCADKQAEVAVDQIRTISKTRLKKKIDRLPGDDASQLLKIITEKHGIVKS